MTFENIENIISLLCTIVGLLYCVFRYIEAPKRGYRFILAFFLANFLSEYYWTIYGLVMRSYPDVSEFAAYLGWNVGFFCLLLAVYFMRGEGAKRLSHPIMLLPVIINVPQFLLYIRYGAVLNNIWMVGTTTLTMILCLQDIAYYHKHRAGRKAFPLFSVLVLAFLIAKYGMWTASCFDWNSELSNPYIYCSILGSLVSVFFGYGARKHYEAEGSGTITKKASEQRFQVLIQTVLSLVIIGICAVGYFTAFWIKGSLSNDSGIIRNERQLVIYLFAISVILILLVLVLLYVLTSRYRHIIESTRRMNEGKRSRLNFFITIVVTLALMVFAVVYNSTVLYNASVVGTYEDGDEEIETLATELENYLTVAVTTLRVAADSVDLMALNGSSVREIEQFIMDQTKRQSEQFDENFTGIYAYINGVYLDGLGWVPPEGYEPTSRDWYKAAVEANGETVIVSPYVDAQTDSVVITICRSISDAEQGDAGQSRNVVCLDVIVNHIQELTQAAEIAGKGYGMIVNADGFIIAHKDTALNGQNIAEVYDQALLNSIVNAKTNRIATKMNGEDCTLFVSPVMDQWYSVVVISNWELFEGTQSQLAINIMVSLITFCLITFFYYMGYKNEEISGKKVKEMNLQVITALATAIDAKDPYTKGHSTRVSEYAVMIANALGWEKERTDDLRYSALLHDIGKIGIPDSILNKPTRLTDVEFDIIKSHTTTGGEILRDRTVVDSAEDVALSHHERYDGKGYPRGLRGKEITEEARIVGIADAFDAMHSNRVYRKACDHDYIYRQLTEGRGKQFDPEYVDVLINLWDQGLLEECLKSGSESEGADQEIEASLHEEVETFVSENANSELLVADIKNAGNYEGALNVEYNQFAKLYEFIAHLEKRFNHPFKLILITLDRKAEDGSSANNLENAMFYMDRAIRISIRDVDIVTKYNGQQFLVIMLGTDLDGVKIAVDRIFKSYFRMNGSNAFSPSYSILEAKSEP